ncbi:MAG: NADH-ubiquinone oxidoreductase-F iron-sulfur binding region domain-containing protein [Pseudomonadota bacterium]
MSNTPHSTETRVPLDALRNGKRRLRHQLKGRQPDDAAREAVCALIGPGPHARDRLIEHLHRLNDAQGALFEPMLVALAAEMRLAMAEVVEVASFYHHFQILPDGARAPEVTLRVCDGLSCEMAGAQGLRQALDGTLAPGVRLTPAPCVGRCEQAPVAVLGQRPVPHASEAGIRAALAGGDTAHPLPASSHARFDPVAFAPGEVPSDETIAPDAVGYAAYRAAGGYRLAADVVNSERSADSVIEALEHAGLRGLGGAGFPAGRKWRIVRGFPAPRLMAVNIDEGEPGTFKDRTFLERDPHRFLEGVLIAAQVVGCEAVYLYLRDEYAGCRALLARELALLQADPPCPLPHIELRRGAGAYICGEESAMIESIEGKRGEPRLRPPYIAEVGLFGRPTLEHNFETLYWVRDIVERGPAWFTGFGRHGRQGLRSFSVSGRVKRPGVKLAPAGITLRELVDEFCGGMAEGHVLYGYLPGGASGGILPAALADVPLDFDTLQPHGSFIGSAAVVVLGQHDRARDAALNAMRFFADESCGQCTPCRVGTEKAARLMEATAWDHATLDDLSAVMADASICGLGQAAPNAIRCVQRYFGDEVTK